MGGYKAAATARLGPQPCSRGSTVSAEQNHGRAGVLLLALQKMRSRNGNQGPECARGGGMGGRARPWRFPASTFTRKQRCFPTPSPPPGDLGAQRPGPSSPGVSLFTQFNASPQGTGWAAAPGSGRRPPATGVRSKGCSAVGAPTLPAAGCVSFPQRLVYGRFPTDALWAERGSCPRGGATGDPWGAGQPLPQQGRASEGP